MKEKLPLFFQTVLITIFLLTTSFAAQSGWKKLKSKNVIYYKPFVKVKNEKNIMVIFITPEGKIYRGRCRKSKSISSYCDALPGKKFDSPFYEITYIVLELNPPLSARIKKTGKVGNKIEEK